MHVRRSMSFALVGRGLCGSECGEESWWRRRALCRSCAANRALDRLLRDLPDASVLLVFATKQDRPGAMPVGDIQHQLQLHQLVDKEW